MNITHKALCKSAEVVTQVLDAVSKMPDKRDFIHIEPDNFTDDIILDVDVVAASLAREYVLSLTEKNGNKVSVDKLPFVVTAVLLLATLKEEELTQK